ALMSRYAQVGLAFATAIGAWVNFALLFWFAARKNLIEVDTRLKQAAGRLALAGVALAVALIAGERLAAVLFGAWPSLREEASLVLLAAIGAAVYFGIVFALFGRQWLNALKRRRAGPPAAPLPPEGE